MTLNDLTVNFSHLNREELLADWRWLIGPTRQPILLTALGDAFLQDPEDGGVHLLDVGVGSAEKVADTLDQFRELLTDREFVTDIFGPQIILDLRDGGKTLSLGEIYSFKTPPALGGEYTTDNLEPTDIAVHFSILGQIHEQIRDLPPGTPIGRIEIR